MQPPKLPSLISWKRYSSVMLVVHMCFVLELLRVQTKKKQACCFPRVSFLRTFWKTFLELTTLHQSQKLTVSFENFDGVGLQLRKTCTRNGNGLIRLPDYSCAEQNPRFSGWSVCQAQPTGTTACGNYSSQLRELRPDTRRISRSFGRQVLQQVSRGWFFFLETFRRTLSEFSTIGNSEHCRLLFSGQWSKWRCHQPWTQRLHRQEPMWPKCLYNIRHTLWQANDSGTKNPNRNLPRLVGILKVFFIEMQFVKNNTSKI